MATDVERTHIKVQRTHKNAVGTVLTDEKISIPVNSNLGHLLWSPTTPPERKPIRVALLLANGEEVVWRRVTL